MSAARPDYPGIGDMWWHADPRDACLGLSLIIAHLEGDLVDDGKPQHVRTDRVWPRDYDRDVEALVACEGMVKLARVNADVPVDKVRAALNYLLDEMDPTKTTLRRF